MSKIRFFKTGGDGEGSMDDFTVAGGSGPNQTIEDGNTLTFASSSTVASVASATDTVTHSVVPNSINATHIDLGTGANQVSAVDMLIADAGGLFTGTEVETALTEVVTRGEWLQNGFPDASEAAISWADGTRTLAISPVSGSFNYYIQGAKYNETGTLSEQITDTEGLWVIYIDSEGTLASVLNPSHAQIDAVINTKCIIVYVYWDATNNDGRLMYELHGSNMAPATHEWLHDHIGAVYSSGMALADFVVNDSGDVNSHAQFSVALGVFYDEDLSHSLSAIASTTGLEIWYLDSSSWRWTTNAGYSVLTTGTGRLAYNNSGAQTEATNNDFVLCHVFATNITNDAGASPKFIAIQGQAQYTTLGNARTGAETEINELVYGTFPLQEVVPVATIIFQTSNGYSNAVKARVRTTESGDNFVDWRGSNLKAGGGAVSDHGNMAGLADDDHLQYLLADGTRALAGPWDMGNQALTNVNIDGGTINDITELVVNGNITQTTGDYLATDQVRAIDGDGLSLTDDGGTGIFIEDGGQVGIGTTGPDRTLDVLDASNPQIRLTHTDGSAYADMQTESNGGLYIRPTGTLIGIGKNSMLNNSGANSYGFAEASLQNNTGDGAIGAGREVLMNNSGTNPSAMGHFSMRDNTGNQSSALGVSSLEGNSGNYVTGAGPSVLKFNVGNGCNAHGRETLFRNTGGSSNGWGGYALHTNIGDDANGLGEYTLRYNEGDNNTALGSLSFNTFSQDTGNEQTWTTALSGNQITVTSHGFGSNGSYRNLEVTTAGVLPTGLSAAIHQWEIIDANTLECRDDTFTAGTGSGTHKVIPQFIYANSTAVGHNAEPDASNQVMLGDANVTEVKTAGALTAETLESNVATGTAPLTVASTTLVSNFNADLLDGQEGSYYATGGTMTTVKEGGSQIGGADITTLDFDTNHFNVEESPDKEINITIASAFEAAVDHITESGASHTYLDQSVVSGATPTFTQVIADQVRAIDGDGLLLSEDGGEGIFVQDGSGHVGIGTIAPDGNLHIVSTSAPELKLQLNDADVVADNTFGNFIWNGGEADSGVEVGRISLEADDDFTASSSPTRMEFATTSTGETEATTKMALKEDGDLGIGTTDPSEKLDVVGNAEINGNVIVTGTVDGVDISADAVADGSTPGVAAFAADDFDAASGVVSLDYSTTAEINTGTVTSGPMPVDQFVASKRNIRYMSFRLISPSVNVSVLSDIGGDHPAPFAGTIVQDNSFPYRFCAHTDEAGTTGTMVVDVHLNGTTIMAANKLDIETTEKNSATAATQPDVTTTSVSAGDIFTFDIDAIHTTPAQGLTVIIPIRES